VGNFQRGTRMFARLIASLHPRVVSVMHPSPVSRTPAVQHTGETPVAGKS